MKLLFRTGDVDQDKRLDIFLQEKTAGHNLSRTVIRKIIDLGGVHIDGNRQRRCGLAIQPGMKIELHADHNPLEPFRLCAEHILFQDDYLIAINKPPGVETQPTPSRYKGCLYEALLVWLGRDKKAAGKAEIGMIQRLDRDTSGVIVFSIHKKAHKSLGEQFQNRTVTKIYQALVAGIPEPDCGELISNLIKDQKTNQMRSVRHGGRQAITCYTTLESYGNLEIGRASCRERVS
jgi:23S rRNA pseudouridine1911/1915/1917 synthase